MLTVNEVIVVEGKYDRIRLSGFIHGTILETGGFRLYHDPMFRDLIRSAAEKKGLIVITDPDSAGFQIRRYLRSFIPPKFIRDVYVPAISGKEPRKSHASKEHLLGVEGLTEEVLIDAFSRAGIRFGNSSSLPQTDEISRVDLYHYGLSGRTNSRNKMNILLRRLNLPERLSSKEACTALNLILTKAELEVILKEIKLI